ncbi:MAG TPA: tRNA 2-thiouridine(34) synthase MnmA [Patescibacteria group bacterium]|nr:tRNA 2-thiouridine(34) synthase MnmA [Patescibacteria group bacterium]
MNRRVVVAMSGGVDSSVAAALLKQRGFEVIGITMCFNLADGAGKRPSCCGRQGIDDARRVADALEIRHYVVNMQKHLEERVIRDFCTEYLQGRTPNPCVRCNQFLKFDVLLKKTLALGGRYLATGHYARIVDRNGCYQLRKAKDPAKDQSYFLYRLTQEQLKYLCFPVGEYLKTEIRKLAGEFSLAVADKMDSQEICFLPQVDYRRFLRDRVSAGTGRTHKTLRPGPLVDSRGKILGEHRGAAFYTIGQREGLGIAAGYPVYVTRIDFAKNTITVGARGDACARQFLVKDASFIGPQKKKVVLKVKIRYNHTESSARIAPAGTRIKVVFSQPQFAVTPGQSAVFYQRDQVLGGGIIDEVIT